MSYPWQIQTLIVEDDQQPIDNYRDIFKQIPDAAPPVFAVSYEEAAKQLVSKSIYHLLIIDLGLPQTSQETAKPGLEPGIQLVLSAREREGYPAPAVLVISGRLANAKLTELHNILKNDFAYGAMVNKGIDEADEIIAALEKIRKYCGVGIHMRDAGSQLCPTLSPREEDLLRRCVLGQQDCIGLDLEWWGTYHGTSCPASATDADTTKVLMGRFLLQDGQGASRPTFFKFEASGNAQQSHRDAGVMTQKLGHVKLCTAIQAQHRSLLVTQQVGDSSKRPISLTEFLVKTDTSKAIPQIVTDIANQLGSLGAVSEVRLAISALVWKWHDIDKLNEIWARIEASEEPYPVRLLEKLKSSSELLLIQSRKCTHGDLNPTNVALFQDGDVWRAYIFDAAGIKEDIATRDLAVLEVTSILHRSAALGDDFKETYKALYEPCIAVPESVLEKSTNGIRENTIELIREIRQYAMKIGDIRSYALLVFDFTMLQLGGLGVQNRGNKVQNPRDALQLAQLTADWYKSFPSGA